jgi:hypothetical protein
VNVPRRSGRKCVIRGIVCHGITFIDLYRSFVELLPVPFLSLLLMRFFSVAQEQKAISMPMLLDLRILMILGLLSTSGRQAGI